MLRWNLGFAGFRCGYYFGSFEFGVFVFRCLVWFSFVYLGVGLMF